jgi:hypothetical protein
MFSRSENFYPLIRLAISCLYQNLLYIFILWSTYNLVTYKAPFFSPKKSFFTKNKSCTLLAICKSK